MVEVADGRVLFLAMGRAYYLQDRSHGERLETRLKWTNYGALAGILIAVGVAAWARIWWIGLLAIPAFLLAVLAERLVVVGCQEATDPVARAEVDARAAASDVDPVKHLVWPGVALALLLVPKYLRGKTGTNTQLLEIAFAALAFVIALSRAWQQYRVRREHDLIGGPRQADNKPIVPR